MRSLIVVSRCCLLAYSELCIFEGTHLYAKSKLIKVCSPHCVRTERHRDNMLNLEETVGPLLDGEKKKHKKNVSFQAI